MSQQSDEDEWKREGNSSSWHFRQVGGDPSSTSQNIDTIVEANNPLEILAEIMEIQQAPPNRSGSSGTNTTTTERYQPVRQGDAQSATTSSANVERGKGMRRVVPRPSGGTRYAKLPNQSRQTPSAAKDGWVQLKNDEKKWEEIKLMFFILPLGSFLLHNTRHLLMYALRPDYYASLDFDTRTHKLIEDGKKFEIIYASNQKMQKTWNDKLISATKNVWKSQIDMRVISAAFLKTDLDAWFIRSLPQPKISKEDLDEFIDHYLVIPRNQRHHDLQTLMMMKDLVLNHFRLQNGSQD